MLNLQLVAVDYYVIAIYFGLILAVGWYVAKKMPTGDDLFLAGRSLGFISIGASLFATNISSTSLIGLSGFAYKYGLAVSNYEWMASIVLIFMAVFIIPIYIRSRITTLPEYLKLRFGVSSQKYFSLISIILCVLLDTAGGIYAGVLVLDTFFPTSNLWIYSYGLALIAGGYTLWGGLKAVVYTDVIQTVVLLLGSFFLTYFLFERFDFDWQLMTQGFDNERLSLIRPLDDAQAPWLGTLIGIPVLGFWFWATNQYSTQRILGAKSITHARGGALLAAALKLLPLFIMILPAVIAINLIPDLKNQDLVYPYMVANLLPAGVTGLVIAGLVAAIMSSLDSALNSSSALIVNDFLKSRRIPLTPHEEGKFGRIAIVTIMILAAAWAPMIAELGGIFDYFQKSFSVVVPPVVTVFLMGLFTNRGGAKTALTTLVLGHLLGLGIFILSLTDWIQIHYTVIVGVVTFICVGIFIGLSYVFGETNNRKDMVFHSDDVLPKNAFKAFTDYRLYALALSAIIVLILFLFW